MNITYKLFPHQKKLLMSNEPVLYARCGRGAGKSFIAALIAVLALIKGQRVICMGQTSQAIREVLVPEILKRLTEIIPGKYKYNQTSNKITYNNGVIFLGSYESLESIRGYTSISLAILDEIALAPPGVFEILSFCMRDCGTEPIIRMMSTPRSQNWLTKFVKENNIPVITAKTSDNLRISEKEIELMRKTCIDENAWKREFFGEEVDDSTDGILFSTSLMIQAGKVKRFNDRLGYNIGVDASGLGVDLNCIVVRRFNEIVKIVKKQTATASELCTIIKGLIHEYGMDNLSMVYIDSAYGLDLYNRLLEYDIPATLIPFGSTADESSIYANKRAEMYCETKRYIDENGMIGLDEELKDELNATRYLLNNSNKIQIIPKADIKLNIGHSPDVADAFALTFAGPIIERKAIIRKAREQCRFME